VRRKAPPEVAGLKFLGTLLLLILIAVAIAGYVVYAPFGPHTETFVEIAPGTPTTAIADQLETRGIIRNRYAFDLMHLRRHRTLKAGEYRFDHPVPMAEVYARMVRGDVYTITLKIPEGYNIFDIAQAVADAGLGSRDAFLAAERQHTELIAWLPPTGQLPQSLEGYLFPDTYSFSRHATPVQMLTAMVHRFRRAAAQIGLTGQMQQTVIMASLVEKEVSQSTERPSSPASSPTASPGGCRSPPTPPSSTRRCSTAAGAEPSTPPTCRPTHPTTPINTRDCPPAPSAIPASPRCAPL
jgi:Predicted periplasmic solute-binding protein